MVKATSFLFFFFLNCDCKCPLSERSTDPTLELCQFSDNNTVEIQDKSKKLVKISIRNVIF